jgi:HK97 family phage portal protein
MRGILREVLARALRVRWLDPRGEIGVVGYGTRSGVTIDEEGALRVAACWIATTLIADELASLASRIVARTDATRQPLRPPELRPLWDRPNAWQTTVEWRGSTVLSLLLWGVAYVALTWDDSGALVAMQTLHPARCELRPREDGGIEVRYLRPDGGDMTLAAPAYRRPDVMVLRLYDTPGALQPISPVRMAAELLGLAVAYDRFAANLAGRGLAPTAVLTVEDAIPPEVAREYSERLTALHGGPDNAGKVAVIGGRGVRLERLTWSPADVQLVAQSERVFQVVMALWRVPPTAAGLVDKPSTWGTGVAEFSRGLERFTLRPIARRLEAAIEDHILAYVDPDLQYRLRFDSLLSASPQERAEVQRTRLMAGMTSVERVLAQEDEPPLSPDETVLLPLNVQTPREREEAQRLRRAEAMARLYQAGLPLELAAQLAGVELPTG